MSQRPPASRPASRSLSDDQRVALPPVQTGNDNQQGWGQVERQVECASESTQPGRQILPSPHAQRPSGFERRASVPSRDSGVRYILNPTEPETTGGTTHRASTTAESPKSAVSASQFAGSPSGQDAFPSLQSARTPPSAGYASAYPYRRILTPRSPRVASIGRGSGTIDAQQSPFIHGRGTAYTGDPGQLPELIPTPPAKTRQQYGFPSATTPIEHTRRHSGGMQAPGRTPQSENVSPSMSTSSQNMSSQTSPTSYSYPPTGQTPVSGSYFQGSSLFQPLGGGGAPGAEGSFSATPSQTGPANASASGGGTSSRQTSVSRDPMAMVTISTSQGLIHVPVDTHQASRLADEKRARNAGASARFRQRRKDKEREASSNIEKLQQQTRELQAQLRETETERDFYRNERDRFRDAVFRNPGMREMVMQAPPSPHAMNAMRSGFFQSSHPPSGPPMTFQPPEPTGERAPRRQRTNTQGDFQGLPYTLPPASTTLPPVPAPIPGFPSAHGGPPSLPPLRIDNPPAAGPSSASTGGSTGQPPSTGTTSAGAQSTPYDPAYPRGAYERAWPGDPGSGGRSR